MRLLILLAALVCSVSQAQAPEPLKQIAIVALPNVAGRIDHLAFDGERQRLFVAALGNDTVEVVDAARNAHLKSLPGFHEPQGIAIAADFGAVAVANGDTGTLQLLDAETFATRWTVEVGGDADNVRYDAAAKQLYVAAEGGLYRVDPASGKAVRRIAIDGHPESFQQRRGDAIERTARVATRAGARTGLWVASNGRLYVAVPARDERGAEARVFKAQ